MWPRERRRRRTGADPARPRRRSVPPRVRPCRVTGGRHAGCRRTTSLEDVGDLVRDLADRGVRRGERDGPAPGRGAGPDRPQARRPSRDPRRAPECPRDRCRRRARRPSDAGARWCHGARRRQKGGNRTIARAAGAGRTCPSPGVPHGRPVGAEAGRVRLAAVARPARAPARAPCLVVPGREAARQGTIGQTSGPPSPGQGASAEARPSNAIGARMSARATLPRPRAPPYDRSP